MTCVKLVGRGVRGVGVAVQVLRGRDWLTWSQASRGWSLAHNPNPVGGSQTGAVLLSLGHRWQCLETLLMVLSEVVAGGEFSSHLVARGMPFNTLQYTRQLP